MVGVYRVGATGRSGCSSWPPDSCLQRARHVGLILLADRVGELEASEDLGGDRGDGRRREVRGHALVVHPVEVPVELEERVAQELGDDEEMLAVIKVMEPERLHT